MTGLQILFAILFFISCFFIPILLIALSVVKSKMLMIINAQSGKEMVCYSRQRTNKMGISYIFFIFKNVIELIPSVKNNLEYLDQKKFLELERQGQVLKIIIKILSASLIISALGLIVVRA